MSDSILEWHLPRRAEIAEGLTVGRLLPFRGGKGIGPFVFLDHIGPHTFPIGQGTEVLPHPHIGLATVTFIFEGALDHRDSLGTIQRIHPYDVNWMTAGSGIVHSERSPQELRNVPQPFHGVQAWVALPVEHEETAPTFEHQNQAHLPKAEVDGVQHTLIAGEAFGLRSPVKTFSRLFYVHSKLASQTQLNFEPEGQEVAFFLVQGTVHVDGKSYTGPGLIQFHFGQSVQITAETDSHGLLLGGEKLMEHRRIWWNFVSSRPERIEEAKKKWINQEFPPVPGETEFVPLPQ